MYTHTYLEPWNYLSSVYPNPTWEISTHPNKGRWVTRLLALNLSHAGEPLEGGWITDNSKNLGQKSCPGASIASHIVWCVCMMYPCCWLAKPVQGTPDPTWSSIGVFPLAASWDKWMMWTHTHTHTYIHTHTHTHTHARIYTHYLNLWNLHPFKCLIISYSVFHTHITNMWQDTFSWKIT